MIAANLARGPPDRTVMNRRRLTGLTTAIAALALAAPAGALAACPGADAEPVAGNLGAIASTTLCLINEQRSAAGLSTLSAQSRLSSASRAYSQRMVAEAFFDHVSPDGGTLVRRLRGIGYVRDDASWTVGENIAWGQGNLSTPGSIVNAWMNSPGHRANILKRDYVEIGLGLAMGSPTDASWGATYTTDFGIVEGDGATNAAAASNSARSRARTTTTKARSAKAKAAARAKARRRARACVSARAAAKRSGHSVTPRGCARATSGSHR